jgi:hypothetical protein
MGGGKGVELGCRPKVKEFLVSSNWWV